MCVNVKDSLKNIEWINQGDGVILHYIKNIKLLTSDSMIVISYSEIPSTYIHRFIQAM